MKRIIVLIDGTWNKEGASADTNVAKLDGGKRLADYIKSKADDETEQRVHYHDGVGADGNLTQRLLGGAIGLGLKQIIKEAYEFIVDDFASGDELHILGFSRGAYAARALAGLIGASGIQRTQDADVFEAAWQHYRIAPAIRQQPDNASGKDQKTLATYRTLAAKQQFHDDRTIKCVGVWDTVGSYGIPAGFGLAPLARYFTLVTLGFHDTSFGDHIEVGLHAVGVDEHRRPFVPTFWTIEKGRKPKGHVEQTWFAGAHCNVGGGYAESGLSDLALVWMVARLQALTGLEFNASPIKADTKPNITGTVVDSTVGWVIDHAFPHYRAVLSPVAVEHGYFINSENPKEENINEKVHWSVIAKRANESNHYDPPNLTAAIEPDQIADVTPEERVLLGLE